MRKKYMFLFCFFAFFLIVQISFADCKSAKKSYKQAISESNTLKKINLLEQTAKKCQTYNVFYELGKAFLSIGKLEQAETAFLKASSYTGNNKTQAKAFYGLAHVYEAMGLENDALMRLRDAKEYDPENENISKKWFELELAFTNKVLPADYIIRSIRDSRASKVSRPNKIRICVNFEFDQYQFTPQGERQARELAKAIGDPINNLNRFIIDGHTDSQGTDEYNYELSRRRALEVKKYILLNTSVSEDRLQIKAFGETKLLMPGNSEKIHSINRRVEVRCKAL